MKQQVEGWLKYDGNMTLKWNGPKKLSVPFGPIERKVITPIWSEVEKSYQSHLVPLYRLWVALQKWKIEPYG